MKKTLFLSAMLATALCSSAFGAGDYTATVTSENSPLNLDNYLNGSNTAIYLTLGNGTTVTNTSSSSDFNKIQISAVTLNDANSTATINVANGTHYGFVKSSFNEQILSLNGGTLQKTGTGELIIINTKVADSDTGTLYIKEGSAKVYSQGGHGLVGRNLALKVGSGATMTLTNYNEVNTLDIESGATVTVENNATLAMNTYSASEAKKVTLSGANSKLQVKAADFDKAANDFSDIGNTGTLRVLGTASGYNAAADTINLAKVTSLSKIEISRIYGTLQAADKPINTNFNLVTESGKAALDITSVAGSEYTFNGAFTGSSNFAVITGKKDVVTMNFNGNLSGWTTTGDAWSGLSIKGGSVIANIGGNVTNNAIANAFNINLDPGQTGKLELNINRDATLTNAVNVTAFSLGEGATVSSTHKKFGAESVTLNAGSSLQLKGAENIFDRTFTSLTLNSNTKVTLGSEDEEGHNHNLTTTSLTVNGSSTLNANLIVSANGRMDFSSGATLTMGCDVTIGNNVTVVIDEAIIDGIVNRGETVAIITGVDQITFLGSWNFVNANGDSLAYANLRLEDAGNGTIVVAPEPATATLSLLALAGLCARRRRH